MELHSNIIITGAAGFIASCMCSYLNKKGFNNLYLVDDFNRENKKRNFEKLSFIRLIDRNNIDSFLQEDINIHVVIHFGAKTDTTEMDYDLLETLNVNFSKKMWHYCVHKNIPFMYASSAATYGDGALGYNDNHECILKLEPLNPYGVSKNEFDKWAVTQTIQPPHWYGLKFFNVFGPNEYHKGRMASVVLHAFKQINENGQIKLFRSHHPSFKDGEQMRDFIYVKDLMEIAFWLLNHLPQPGLYNVGTGKAETFLSLAKNVFSALEKEEHIEFIDTPIDIRDKYQYFTEANMQKLLAAGYNKPFHTFEEAIQDYVVGYLNTNTIY